MKELVLKNVIMCRKNSQIHSKKKRGSLKGPPYRDDAVLARDRRVVRVLIGARMSQARSASQKSLQVRRTEQAAPVAACERMHEVGNLYLVGVWRFVLAPRRRIGVPCHGCWRWQSCETAAV